MVRRWVCLLATAAMALAVTTTSGADAAEHPASSGDERAAGLLISVPDRVDVGQVLSIEGESNGVAFNSKVEIQQLVRGGWTTVRRARTSDSGTFSARVTPTTPGWKRFRARLTDHPGVVSNTDRSYARAAAELSLRLVVPSATDPDQRLRVRGTTNGGDGSRITFAGQAFTAQGGRFSGPLEQAHPSADAVATVVPTDWRLHEAKTTADIPGFALQAATEAGRQTLSVAAPARQYADLPIDFLVPGDRFGLRTQPAECDHRPVLIADGRLVPRSEGWWTMPEGDLDHVFLRFAPCGDRAPDFLVDLVDPGAPAGQREPASDRAEAASPAGVVVLDEVAITGTQPGERPGIVVDGRTDLGRGQEVRLQRRTTADAWTDRATLRTAADGSVHADLTGAYSGVLLRLRVPRTSDHPRAVTAPRRATPHVDVPLTTGTTRTVMAPQGIWTDYQFAAEQGQKLTVGYYEQTDGDYGDAGCRRLLYHRGTVLAAESEWEGGVSYRLPATDRYTVRISCFDDDSPEDVGQPYVAYLSTSPPPDAP